MKEGATQFLHPKQRFAPSLPAWRLRPPGVLAIHSAADLIPLQPHFQVPLFSAHVHLGHKTMKNLTEVIGHKGHLGHKSKPRSHKNQRIKRRLFLKETLLLGLLVLYISTRKLRKAHTKISILATVAIISSPESQSLTSEMASAQVSPRISTFVMAWTVKLASRTAA